MGRLALIRVIVKLHRPSTAPPSPAKRPNRFRSMLDIAAQLCFTLLSNVFRCPGISFAYAGPSGTRYIV
jgi:hypothetical protein